MLRFLPLLTFALLPAAVAAPVPPGGGVEFGTNGLLTRADLEKVNFGTRPYVPPPGAKQRAEEPEEKEAEKAKQGAPSPKNRYDLAVHIPWTTFREGEPIPTYFVLRNNRPTTLGLGSRIIFERATPTLAGGDASFDVRDRATGKSMRRLLSARTNCGGGSLVDVPADGYYCQKADLNRATGAPLPPGEYEVDWHQGRLASAPVAFTVRKADRKPPPLQLLPAIHFFSIRNESDDEVRRALRAGERPARTELVSWTDCSLNYTHTESMSAALAVGQGGAFVPDLYTIPAADKLISASVEWKRYREGDRLAVTLRAVSPHEQVRLEELPQLFLQVETREVTDRDNWEREAYREGKQFARDANGLATPLTIEVHLPKEWRERIAANEARVAVLIAAKRVELPTRGGVRLEELRHSTRAVDSKAGVKAAPVWSGIVRTPFADAPPRQQLVAPPSP